MICQIKYVILKQTPHPMRIIKKLEYVYLNKSTIYSFRNLSTDNFLFISSNSDSFSVADIIRPFDITLDHTNINSVFLNDFFAFGFADVVVIISKIKNSFK